MERCNAEELARLRASADKYQARSRPDEAAVRVDVWWIEKYVKGPAVLEMGCADGVGTEMLLRRAKSLDVVDGSAKYCALVRERIRDVRLSVTNSLYEEFTPARSYNDIVFARSLEIVENPVAIIFQISQWLEPQGRVHIVVQNAESLHRRIGHALGLLPAIDAISEQNVLVGNRRIYTRAMLADYLEQGGLRIEVIKGYLLKPFDYATMSHAPVNLATQLIPALYAVGKSVPDDLCHFWYALCVKS